MPQAGPQLRSKMEEYFGDPVLDQGPMKYLKDQGYKLTKDFLWIPKEGVAKYEDMEEKEWDCLLFLIEEWDMGGFKDART